MAKKKKRHENDFLLDDDVLLCINVFLPIQSSFFRGLVSWWCFHLFTKIRFFPVIVGLLVVVVVFVQRSFVAVFVIFRIVTILIISFISPHIFSPVFFQSSACICCCRGFAQFQWKHTNTHTHTIYTTNHRKWFFNGLVATIIHDEVCGC